MFRRNSFLFVSAAVLLAIHFLIVTAQQPAKAPNPGTDWPMFSHDLAATRFSPLKQINGKNVGTLKLAWTMPYRADRNSGPAGGLGAISQATPIVVHGIMYVPDENRVLALDAA